MSEEVALGIPLYSNRLSWLAWIVATVTMAIAGVAVKVLKALYLFNPYKTLYGLQRPVLVSERDTDVARRAMNKN